MGTNDGTQSKCMYGDVAHSRPSRVWNSQRASVLRRAALPLAVMLLALPGSGAAAARTESKPVLRVQSSRSGEINLEAHGASIDDVLSAIAARTGLEVLIEPGITRPPVNITMPMAPVADVLREILRGRNYSFVYDGENPVPHEVIVLRPSVPGPAPARSRPPFRR